MGTNWGRYGCQQEDSALSGAAFRARAACRARSRLEGSAKGQVQLIRCSLCSSAWTMDRARRGEASGLGLDHRLEGIAGQCPLLLQGEADLRELSRKTGPR